MSQENVEIVRRYYEAYAQGGLDRLMDYWSDDLDHRATTEGIDDPGPVRGKRAMRHTSATGSTRSTSSGSRRWN